MRGAKIIALPTRHARTNKTRLRRSSGQISSRLPPRLAAGVESGRPLRRPRDPQVKRDLERADAESLAFEEAYKGKLAALADGPDAGAVLAEAVTRYEALDDLLGRLDLLCRARPRRQHRRSRAREILRRRAGAHHGGLDASVVLHARTQSARRREARSGHAGSRARRTTGRGSRTSARRSPISSRIASSSSSTKNR